MISKTFCLLIFAGLTLCWACSDSESNKDEQLRIDTLSVNSIEADTTTADTLGGISQSKKLLTSPKTVVLTGLNQHRLVTVYKFGDNNPSAKAYSLRKKYYDDDGSGEREQFFMPGIDLIHGYNLLNIGHYDLTTEKLNFLFDHSVLIKSLYYPSFEQDSLYKRPINRDYYLVSVYDADTNRDTLINNNDLRRFYHFNASASAKTMLLPTSYSATRSEYDPKNDVMYIFARFDANANGRIDTKEPTHIFWISLKSPAIATRLY
jgi:hypothetical protein